MAKTPIQLPEKIGDLMRQMGFREDAPDSLKRAFVLNLMRAAYPSEPVAIATEPEQLAFNRDQLMGHLARNEVSVRRSG